MTLQLLSFTCRVAVVGIALTWGAVHLSSQEPSPSAPAPCSGPEYRQFDFWIGEWEVRSTGGEVVGRNVIEPILGGCALRESWTAAAGSQGTSYNIFDRATGRWHQSWVDGSGLLLLLDGTLQEGSMVLSGERPGPDGAVRHRITWQPLPGGRIRQLWQSSTASGDAWETVFDGYYTRLP